MPDSSDTFPSVPQAALLLLASFLLQYVVGAALHDHRHTLGLDQHQLTAMALLIANGLVLATVLHFQRRRHRDLLHSSPSSVLATTALLTPAVLLLVPLILHLDHTLVSALEYIFPLSQWEEQAFAQMVADSLGAIVATCILAPVLEEMLFRGVLLRSFLNQHQRWPAIAASALFFGAAHFNIYQFVLAFLLGLVLGWLYERSRSLIPCIALHATLNTWILLSAHSTPAQAEEASSGFTFSSWVAAALSALLGAVLLRRFLSAGRGSDRADAA